MRNFNDDLPIYLQLREELEKVIINGDIEEEETIPSIRNISKEYKLNPNTVSKAISGLVNDEILYKKRGIGIFVKKGGRKMLMKKKTKGFVNKEMPEMITKAKRLEIPKKEVIDQVEKIYNEE